MKNQTFISERADIEAKVLIGEGCRIWDFVHIRSGAVLGHSCIVGKGAYIDANVIVGDNCKIQNNSLLYSPASLGNGVFVGPGAVLTNDVFPRAINPDGSRKKLTDWHPVGVTIGDGASVGAMAVCVAPLTIGEWAMVGAGSVVTKDVLPYSLVAGVPAVHIGWVGRAGLRLEELDVPFTYRCPATGEVYYESDGQLRITEADQK